MKGASIVYILFACGLCQALIDAHVSWVKYCEIALFWPFMLGTEAAKFLIGRGW